MSWEQEIIRCFLEKFFIFFSTEALVETNIQFLYALTNNRIQSKVVVDIVSNSEKLYSSVLMKTQIPIKIFRTVLSGYMIMKSD